MSTDYSHTIDEYANLDSAANGLNSSVNTMSNDIQSANDIMKRLQSNSFQGPVANHISQMWNVISKTTQNNVSSLNQNANLINEMNQNYQQKDYEVSKEVGER